jgi:hypothetical protein
MTEIIGFNFPTIIGGLVVVGIVFQVWSGITYSTELGYAERLRDAIQRFLDQPGKVTPLKSSELLDRESVEPMGMVGTRVREIEIFSDYAGMVALHDLGAVAAETDAGKFRNAFPGTLIASLLVLGLMGTLWSLRSTLGSDDLIKFVQKDATIESKEKPKNSDAEGSMNTSKFQKALGKVVSGFGDAFLASIFGVGGTIILISGRVVVRSRREKCFAEIEKLAIEQLLPYYIEPEQNALKRATDMLDNGASHYKDATKNMERQSEQLQGSIAELTSSTKEANKVFGAEGAVVYQLSEFTKAANGFNSNANTVALSVEKSTAVMQALVVDCNKLLKALEQQTNEQIERQISISEKLERTITESNSSLSENITELVNSNADVHESLNQQSKTQLDAFNDLTVNLVKKLSVTLDSLSEDNGLLINGLIKYTNEHSKKSDSVQEELEQMIKGISSSITGLGDKNEEFVNILVFESKDASNERATEIKTFELQIQELKTAVEGFTQSNTETSDMLLKHLKDNGDKGILKQNKLNDLIEKLCDKLDNLTTESETKESKSWWERKK